MDSEQPNSRTSATASNPRGHFEQETVVALNAALIASRGGEWNNPWDMGQAPLTTGERDAIDATFAAFDGAGALVVGLTVAGLNRR